VVLAAGAAENDIFTALAYDSATQITEGDTTVEVTDSGTGKIEFTVDNVEVADFTTGEVVFNETGANQDFRVEGDSNANLLIADAGVDKVGIGTNTFNTNGGVLQVSNGISFPATQSACSDANTLDDYEEGEWTPTLVPTGTGFTSITYDADTQAKYVKIGKNVFVQGAIRTSAITIGSPTGLLSIGNFPFTMSSSTQGGNGTSAYASLAVAFATDWPASSTPTGALTVTGSTIAYLTTRATSNGAFAYASPSNVNTGSFQNVLYFAGCYISAN
jgi:hypothetical protein